MSELRKKKLSTLSLGWALPLLTVAGFSLAIPESDPALEIEDLSLYQEEAHPFDRSVREGLNPLDLMSARSNIDTVTPNMVINNTNIDTVTPNMVINNTNIDTVTPNMVINNTNIAVTTPGTVIHAGNERAMDGIAPAGGAVSFFPRSAELPEPTVALNEK